jgi:hypothetical protein
MNSDTLQNNSTEPFHYHSQPTDSNRTTHQNHPSFDPLNRSLEARHRILRRSRCRPRQTPSKQHGRRLRRGLGRSRRAPEAPKESRGQQTLGTAVLSRGHGGRPVQRGTSRGHVPRHWSNEPGGRGTGKIQEQGRFCQYQLFHSATAERVFRLWYSQVLFCNGDRIEPKTDKGWKDTYSGFFLQGKDDPCPKAGATDLTLAETYQMDNNLGDPLTGEPSDQLQICPWFLQWYEAQTYKVALPLKEKKMIGRRPQELTFITDLGRHFEPQSQNCKLGSTGSQRI